MRLTGRGALLACALCAAPGCSAEAPPAPRRFLAITHPALNRVSFFDLDRGAVAGVLPAQKLPHDMLLSADRNTLFVVNSGAQCVAAYRLGSAELWREARAFMRRDTARAVPSSGRMFGAAPHPPVSTLVAPRAAPAPATPAFLNPEPVQSLPPEVATFALTDRRWPAAAAAVHASAGAGRHASCFDCHERSLGTKPFSAVFSASRDSIFVVQLAGRSIALLDAATLEIRRQIPLEPPGTMAPIEMWLRPGTHEAFVTCREEIGRSQRGAVLVVDVATGVTLATIPVGIYPWHLLPVNGGRKLLVNNFQSSRISVVDVAARQVVDSLIVQNGPAGMALSPDGRDLYVTCFYTHRLLIVDLASGRVRHEVPVGSNPTAILPAADGASAFVLCGGESALHEVDLRAFQVRRRFPLLFGAYTFLLVERDRSRRLAAAAGMLLPNHEPGVGR